MGAVVVGAAVGGLRAGLLSAALGGAYGVLQVGARGWTWSPGVIVGAALAALLLAAMAAVVGVRAERERASRDAERRAAAPLVRVRVQPLDAEGLEVEVVVEDDGSGFSATALERFRDRCDVSTFRGSGFGLVIVQRAIETLGGRVWLGRSADLGGAAVHVLLPAATGEALRADRPKAGAPTASGAPEPEARTRR